MYDYVSINFCISMTYTVIYILIVPGEIFCYLKAPKLNWMKLGQYQKWM